MAHYFPTRTKTQVKKKGLRENKSNPDRVTRAILNRGTIGESALGDHEQRSRPRLLSAR